ncbi:MAG: hypothetical protein GQ542_20220 [Desulforhopalus sp.]|nr:hypothetical protein [Desulforhopalus sp.]
MKFIQITCLLCLSLSLSSVWATNSSLNHYKMLTSLEGDWMLSPAYIQEGGTTKKDPAAKLIGTDNTAISFKIIGEGSTIQEDLLPGTDKEMMTMYHCNDFKDCSQVQAKHYCAKQNQPELVLDTTHTTDRSIVMTCDMNTSLCNSDESHIHTIKHVLSQGNNHLRTTYATYKDGRFKKNSIYHFDRKK